MRERWGRKDAISHVRVTAGLGAYHVRSSHADIMKDKVPKRSGSLQYHTANTWTQRVGERRLLSRRLGGAS